MADFLESECVTGLSLGFFALRFGFVFPELPLLLLGLFLSLVVCLALVSSDEVSLDFWPDFSP